MAARTPTKTAKAKKVAQDSVLFLELALEYLGADPSALALLKNLSAHVDALVSESDEGAAMSARQANLEAAAARLTRKAYDIRTGHSTGAQWYWDMLDSVERAAVKAKALAKRCEARAVKS